MPLSPSHISQIGIHVTDLDRAKAFYGESLGLAHLFDAPPRLAFYQCGQTRLMLAENRQAGGRRRRHPLLCGRRCPRRPGRFSAAAWRDVRRGRPGDRPGRRQGRLARRHQRRRRQSCRADERAGGGLTGACSRLPRHRQRRRPDDPGWWLAARMVRVLQFTPRSATARHPARESDRPCSPEKKRRPGWTGAPPLADRDQRMKSELSIRMLVWMVKSATPLPSTSPARKNGCPGCRRAAARGAAEGAGRR